MKRLLLLVCFLGVLAPLLSVDANAPPGRYVISNGTVLDTRTQLIWQQIVDPGTTDVYGADGYCSNLQLNGGGWRVPMISELLTIADRTRSNPAIDTSAFPNTPSEPFWSYSGDAGYGGGGYWAVMFDSGSSSAGTNGQAYRVRCVKEGPGYGL